MTPITPSFSHHRRSPSASFAPKPKSTRPVLQRRGVSLCISKLGSGARSSKADDSEPDMAASFLNFCAMCEKQITVPNSALLYCSESCRRKDSYKPLSASWPSMSSSASTTPPTSPPLSPRTIVAPMTPTKVQTNPIPAICIPNNAHEAKTELDPTEWKPVISPSHTSTSLASSDAWHYLSQFHGRDGSLLVRRPCSTHRSTTSLPALVGAVPFLTHSPSTMASSSTSSASDYIGDTAQRPLPPRHNPCFSGGACATKGVELVVPRIASGEDVGVADAADSPVWEDSPGEKASSAPISMTPIGSGSVVRKNA